MLYMGSSTGATLHLHYCMGKLVEMGLWHGKAPKCSNCDTKKKMAASCNKQCCQDKHQKVQVAKDQQTAPAVFHLMVNTATLPVTIHHYPVLPEALVTSVKYAYPPGHAPPLPKSTQLYLLNSTFLI